MKILLVNPPPRSINEPNTLVPPLGLGYLAAVLEKNKIGVEILDASALQLSWEEFKQEVKRRHPSIIGYTGTTPAIDTTFKAARISRPYSKYQVLGGPHATLFGKEVFQQSSDFDYLVIGEGEYIFLELARNLIAKKDPSTLAGLITKKKTNPRPPAIKDLDALPFPTRHLLPNHLYRYDLVKKYPFTTIISSRGCPYGCLFCEKSVFGNLYRARSAENVVAEIEDLVKKEHVRTIIFFDDLFTVNRARVIRICQLMIEKKLKIDWKAEARVNTVDEEMLKIMKKAGCSVLGYGVESANQKSLDFLKKGTTVAQIKKVFRLTKKVGIKALGYFIFGIPGETYREAQKTIDLSLKISDFAAYNILTPYPGTPLYQLAQQKGWLKATDKARNPFDQHNHKAALVSPEWSEADLRKILAEANRRYFFRPRFILNQIVSFQSPTQILTTFRYGWRVLKWYLK
jgi:radical SAM superfamily enzyme YgiQ (UPF0313 family)